MEKEIREHSLSIGVDDVGFANASDYNSPKSYEITKFLPDAKSIIVLAFKVLSSCESPSLSVALNGYLDLDQFARNANYQGSPEEKKELLMSEEYQRLRQSQHLGIQYQCFNCMKSCPVGQ